MDTSASSMTLWGRELSSCDWYTASLVRLAVLLFIHAMILGLKSALVAHGDVFQV